MYGTRVHDSRCVENMPSSSAMTKNASASTASPSSACPAEACSTCSAGSGAGAAGEAAAVHKSCSMQQSSRASRAQEKVPCMPSAQGQRGVTSTRFHHSIRSQVPMR